MNRIVLDTNSLIQIISIRSKYHNIWKSILHKKVILCITNEILEEYEEILVRLTNYEYAQTVLSIILDNKNTEFISPSYRFNLIPSDPDDNKFVDCAIIANAKYIVTEDNHFRILQQIDFPKVDIISLDDFLIFVNSL